MHCTQCGQALAADEQFCPACGAPREASGVTFEQAEQEYFRLRGQLDTRRITPEQFESALKNLLVQDAQGRYWMLGADSGAWYVHDGQQWIRAASPAAISAASSAPRNSAAPFVILGVIVLVLLALLALGVYWFLLTQNSGSQNAALVTSTPASALAIVPTSALLPTLVPIAPTSQPTIISPSSVPPTSTVPTAPPSPAATTTVIPTVAPETALPIITLAISTAVVLEAATATLLPPTDMPSPSPLPTETLAPTIAPTRTRVPPTRTPEPTETPAPTEPAYPPGVYVTHISTEPAEPKRNQGVAFLVTFVNTTGATQQYNWLIQLYDAESNRRFGETLVQGLTVPPGTSVQTSPNNWQVGGAGGCIQFYAQAQFQNTDGGRIPFTSPEGNTFVHGFTVCP